MNGNFPCKKSLPGSVTSTLQGLRGMDGQVEFGELAFVWQKYRPQEKDAGEESQAGSRAALHARIRSKDCTLSAAGSELVRCGCGS